MPATVDAPHIPSAVKPEVPHAPGNMSYAAVASEPTHTAPKPRVPVKKASLTALGHKSHSPVASRAAHKESEPKESEPHVPSVVKPAEPTVPGNKSYADAIAETPPTEPATPVEAVAPAESKEEEAPHVPAVVKPPVPSAPGNKSYAGMVLQTPPESPRDQQESFKSGDTTTPGEFEGKGLDESPRTPTFGHKRAGSRSSPKARSRGRGSPSPSPKVPEESLDNMESIVYEKYEGDNGQRLMSVKASSEYDEALKLDKREYRPSGQKEIKSQELELTSGRQAAAGWEKSGIRWAPLNVPLKRRLQTLVVLGHTLSAFSLLAGFFCLCAIPLFWPVILPYLIYVFFSKAGTSGNLTWRSERYRRNKIWSLFASYFPARLHRTAELPATRKYIFGYHPHGIISHGAFASFSTEALGFSQLFPGIKNTLLTLDSNFRVPFYREYILSMGLASVSRKSCENLLSKGGPNGEGMGRAITIVVGGARESLETHPGTLRLVLNCRKGFVKLAIRQGADLVPVLAFGENDIYEQLNADSHPRLHRLQMIFKKFMGFTVPVFHARGIFNYDVGMMPYRRPMNIVVGRPILVKQQKDKPDEAYLDEIHQKYIDELQSIWDTWKDTFAKERKADLQIVE